MRIEGKRRGQVILRQVTGYACLAIGAAGCVLPILPGIPLLLAGLGLLAVDSPWAAQLRDRLKEYAGKQLSKLRGKVGPESQAAKAPPEIRHAE
jgi:uncharacterized membrane protein YbaN (DUF454 family)